MENRPIYADGVDVSECEFYPYTDDICREYGKCQNNPNCYYKQLQRTQTQYNEVVEQNKGLQQELKRKEEECYSLSHGQHLQNGVIKDLQEQLQSSQQKVKELEESSGFWGRTTARVQSERDKYKQALEEIKEILDKPILEVSENPQCQGEFMIDYNAQIEERAMQLKQILQKCEVLNR